VPALRLDRIRADQYDGMSWHQGDVLFMVFGCADMLQKHTGDCCCDADTGRNHDIVCYHKHYHWTQAGKITHSPKAAALRLRLIAVLCLLRVRQRTHPSILRGKIRSVIFGEHDMPDRTASPAHILPTLPSSAHTSMGILTTGSGLATSTWWF
jgi:hypothetical protein